MTASTARQVAAGWTGLCALAALSAGALWLLGLRLLAVTPRSVAAVGAARIEDWVELAVLVGGVGVALWLLAGSVAGVVAAGRARWRGSPASVEALGRWAPVLVRRLARGAVGLGVGAGLALTPVAATAADLPAPQPATVEVLDLGWQSTTAGQGESVDRPQDVVAPVDLPSPPETAPAAAETVTDASTRTTAEPTGEPTGEPTAAPESAEARQTAGVGETADADAAETPTRDTTSTSADTTSTTSTSTGTEDAERPLDAQRTSRTVTTTDDERPVEVVVVRGDTLWDIAARTLPGDATDAQILRETVRWHEANRDVVGDDPDVVLPGQILRGP
ncbi:hypothetical protein ACNHYB_15355 [Isoptericola jiangsuensis]|uniref:hypothetical protein n=1 Tax=Isoptericola jiangsuensis TaxID=548579 RepID=UPI003AABE673